MPKARITILKRTFQADILEREIRDEAFRRSFEPCPIFEEGQMLYWMSTLLLVWSAVGIAALVDGMGDEQ